ncbi:MAG: UDP-N-acetylglucosamine 2-epimerase (non-hydrolyzing) [Acidimicrobiales bacterium]|nr:UDP-N-acetylglucosamine 2-epimerase (non-hydrolyzing) [Acidimicrobiales bacterium]
MHAVCVAAARPNFMKVKPVLDALEACGAATSLVHAGQHYDPDVNDVFFADLGLRPPDHHLGSGSGSQATQTARVMTAFEPLLDRLAPDVVVVVGDVTATLAVALVTAKSPARLAHVEAGLRSGNREMPEEVNRLVVDRLSDDLFAPSPDAVGHLRAEGVPEEAIHLVGNVMVDTLLANVERARQRPTLAVHGVVAGGYGLVTLHRPANVDDPEVLDRLLGALGTVAASCPLIFPVHPRTRAALGDRTLPAGVRAVPPLGYLDFLALEDGARVVLTDSGGVQEETTVLGVPCLTLREETERPITVTEGTNRVVGRDPDRIVAAAAAALGHRGTPHRPEGWDGRAAERIAAVVCGR